jgi:hypothetical protein
MFSAQDSTEIRRPAPAVFAMLDDFPHMQAWLESCISLTARPPAARTVGTPLAYRYTLAGQEGEMAGKITAHVPEQELAMELTDSHFDVAMSFRLEPTEFGVRVHHSIAVELKFAPPRYMEAMIQAGNRKQVGSNLTRLKRLVESTAEPPIVS